MIPQRVQLAGFLCYKDKQEVRFDGAYMFANPTVCHWVAAKFDIPVLAVVFNNARYGAVRRATPDLRVTR